MRFAVIYSEKDEAGKSIVEELKKIAFIPQIPIIGLRKEIIFSEDINEKNFPELKDIDFIVFASCHKSEKNFPSLCLHTPGNWRSAEFGGKEGKVCKTSAYVMKYLFEKLNFYGEEAKKNFEINSDYNITLEVTHHGPLVDIPCCFIELGSNEKNWKDTNAARVIAKTILSLQNINSENWIPCIALGGPHYAPNFNKVQLYSEYAISHIIPEYSFPITEHMLKEAESKTIESIKYILIDWKGCGKSEERSKILEILKKLGFSYRRTSEINTKNDNKEEKLNKTMSLE